MKLACRLVQRSLLPIANNSTCSVAVSCHNRRQIRQRQTLGAVRSAPPVGTDGKGEWTGEDHQFKGQFSVGQAVRHRYANYSGLVLWCWKLPSANDVDKNSSAVNVYSLLRPDHHQQQQQQQANSNSAAVTYLNTDGALRKISDMDYALEADLQTCESFRSDDPNFATLADKLIPFKGPNWRQPTQLLLNFLKQNWFRPTQVFGAENDSFRLLAVPFHLGKNGSKYWWRCLLRVESKMATETLSLSSKTLQVISAQGDIQSKTEPPVDKVELSADRPVFQTTFHVALPNEDGGHVWGELRFSGADGKIVVCELPHVALTIPSTE